jgi:hypothetical protein
MRKMHEVHRAKNINVKFLEVLQEIGKPIELIYNIACKYDWACTKGSFSWERTYRLYKILICTDYILKRKVSHIHKLPL